jgi:flagellin-like protein
MKFHYKINNKGLSTVIATLMLILLTLVLVGILWAVISNLVSNKLEDTQSCFDNFEKVKVNEQYTCFNGSTNEFQFSISIGDVKVDEVLVGISGDGQKKSLKISNTPTVISGLRPYKGLYTDTSVLPQNNSGLTYVYNLASGGFSTKPTKVELAPVISGNQCDVSGSTQEIVYCGSLA